MTHLPATEPHPDLTRLRTRRDRADAHRIYHDTDLLGTITRRRDVGTTGRRCWRWYVTPAVMAWTLGRIGERAPEDSSAAVALPAAHLTLADAERALCEHLRAHAAPAVTPLYGPDHA